MNKHLTAVLLFLFIYLPTVGQQTAVYTNDLTEFNKAMDLYNNDQFLAAQPLFQKLERTAEEQGLKGDCAYYAANCAVRLNQQGADAMMEAFFKEYPTSLKRNSAYLEVAEYYFENAKYSRAQKWYDKVDDAGLSKGQMEKFNFNNGYANFKAKRYSEAQKYFNRVSNSNSYGAQAKYYLGFIAYENDEYDEATEYFDEVKDQERYGQDLSYYQADMNFKLGNFDKAIELGLEQFDTADRRDQSELAKIIGESYFNLGKYAEAVPYLKQYKGKRGRWNNTDHYLLGYAYYKQQDYQSAISEFNKIIDGRDAVAQNAFYHLAESYLKSDKKQEALNAFKNASEMDFSDEIREDAWLNYAKISYEIGNPYESVPQVLAGYLEQYPDSPNKDELEDLLIDSYITSKNYKEALVLLEKNKSFDNKLAYQKVAFYRAVELYNENDYDGAKEFFELSLKEPRDTGYTARATYWKAQADYEQSNFSEALIGYRQFLQLPGIASLEESTHIDYHKSYTHFKLKEYPQAIDGFTNFVSKTGDLARKNDAYLRLGDSYFVTSKYWPAMENYNAAIEGGVPDTDYAEFQKAISYGFVGRPNQKIDGLQNFADKYPRSVYKDDAIYELGNTYVATDDIPAALRAYDRLIADNERSSYVPKAMLKKALLLENKGNSTQALDIFKDVAARYPSTDEALQAVSSAKLIYIDQGRVDEYGAWVSRLDFVEVADSELDDASYQAAEQQYLANNNKQAIERFDKYVNEFPRGRHALQANFYLAQLYFGASEFQKTIPHYQFVCDLDRNEFTEAGLGKVVASIFRKRRLFECYFASRALRNYGRLPAKYSICAI